MTQSAFPVEPAPAVLGLDVAKNTVVLHDARSGRATTIANTKTALRAALAPFADHDLAVCEATGGYERAVLDAAFVLGLPIHRADAAKVKAFIASHGGQAKTDVIDARWLARYAAERGTGLAPWKPPAPEREAFAELVRHRQDLLAQRTQAKNRRAAPGGAAVDTLLARQIAFLDEQIDQIDRALADLLKAVPALARAEADLRAVPGLGPVAARTLLALLPELGALSGKQAASLAGLAPHPRDSGERAARRRIRGGRAALRPVLFMAALSAARRHPRLARVYDRLIAAGKPTRLALAAIARKLVVIANAVLRDSINPKSKLT